MRSKTLPPIDDDVLIQAVNSGVRLSEVGAMFDISVSAVVYHMDRLGLPRRNKRKQSFRPGQKVGKWTLLERVVDKRHVGRWMSKCDCGTEGLVSASSLGRNRSMQCRRCMNEWLTADMPVPPRYITSIRASARWRGLEFKLTRGQLSELFLKQNQRCALTGIPLRFQTAWKPEPGEETTASLDRIDSGCGYEILNVQWVHKDINRIKCDFPQDVFIAYCKAVAEEADRSAESTRSPAIKN